MAIKKNSLYYCYVRIYANQVYWGRMKFDAVPADYKDDVLVEARKKVEIWGDQGTVPMD
ncbi:MAG: hypothetical protein SPL39_02980 [Selenomonadaceae bacterium]|nr:hypothetical protein [Selenomonadaceae bacterium]